MPGNFTPSDFVQQAMRTRSNLDHRERACPERLEEMLVSAVTAGRIAKVLKKAIFGGQDLEVKDSRRFRGIDALNPDILHAVLGIVNESGESAEALEASMEHGELVDLPNLDEECGDLLWFIALYCTGRGVTMESLMQKVIAKLRVRFPDRFDPAMMHDWARDRKAEQDAMRQV